MISENQIDQIMGMDVVDSTGSKIGSASQVYLDDQTGQPEWVTVKTGLLGTKETLVPLSAADMSGNQLRVPYEKSKITGAPNQDPDGHLSPEEEQELYRYYGMDYGTGYETTDRVETTTTTQTTGDDAMTRSEERLNVGKERVQSGRARLRKRVVHDQQTVNVPIEREELVLEREPITDANIGDATSGPDLKEDQVDVTLYEERAVVNKETVPVERVRVGKEVHTETEAVSADVAREEIEIDADGDGDTDLRER
jgi:uncharacterized protein (TIGR02271 family)